MLAAITQGFANAKNIPLTEFPFNRHKLLASSTAFRIDKLIIILVLTNSCFQLNSFKFKTQYKLIKASTLKVLIIS